MYTLIKNYSGIKYFYDDDYLTLKDASKHFGFNIGYFLIWIESILPAIKEGKIIYVKIGDVIELVKSGNA
jgi:hypothetical protein